MKPLALSSAAEATLATLDRVRESLSTQAEIPGLITLRPHPLLLLVRRGEFAVVLLPACVWDNGRDILEPYVSRLAGAELRLVILGRPHDPELGRALNRGLSAIVPAEPDLRELLVSLNQAFELMEAKGRSESRGRWMDRYEYELGELLEIARAITTEREIDKLLGLILEKARFVTGA
ncbi:MAG TPA: hypothetical protein VK524_08640, partial [Polyangiaceae bacterium]|nr:hypothetical protein [Polyangiaceae bacterium]